MQFRREVSIERLRELLSYDSETGILTWRIRPIRPGKRDGAMDKGLNRLFAGNPAGSRSARGYILIGIDGQDYLAHRVIFAWMTGAWPTGELDHRNGKKYDNRWCNIRPVTRAQNITNRGTPRNNTSGHRGVSWRKDIKKWRVYLICEGQWHAGGTVGVGRMAIAVAREHPRQ